MYTYYCKDTNCQGHTKSWERCCDMRAFNTNTGWKQAASASGTMTQTRTPYYPLRKQVFA